MIQANNKAWFYTFAAMVTTASEIAEIETFFKGQQLPKEFKLNAAATINDLPTFVQRTLENLKNPQVSDRVNGPRWDDLNEIKKLLAVRQQDKL